LTSNTVVGNNIAYNYIGTCFVASSDNKLFHNNFVENQRQVYIWTESGYCFNVWDDGYPSGGNYWSNYSGEDIDHDGIGDTPYIIDPLNKDEFPLTGRFSTFNVSLPDGTSYNINITSNSTLSNLQFSLQDRVLSFDVEGEAGSAGFCRVAVPLSLMWCDYADEWIVIVGDQSVQPHIIEHGNCTYIYINFTHCKKTVEIRSSHVISEFPSKTIMPLIMIVVVLTSIIHHYKRNIRPVKKAV
jgi:parallel beta-helix repeat protein